VDWNAVALQSGYGSAKSAQTRYGQIVKKLALAEPEMKKTDKKTQQGNGGVVGSGTNLGAMKVTKSGAKAAPGKARVRKMAKSLKYESTDSDGDDDQPGNLDESEDVDEGEGEDEGDEGNEGNEGNEGDEGEGEGEDEGDEGVDLGLDLDLDLDLDVDEDDVDDV
jgi:hypothetical protein